MGVANAQAEPRVDTNEPLDAYELLELRNELPRTRGISCARMD